jgi:DNA-binding transcriptional regulator PaaX
MAFTTQIYYGIYNPTYNHHKKKLNYKKDGKLGQWVANTPSSIEAQIQTHLEQGHLGVPLIAICWR